MSAYKYLNGMHANQGAKLFKVTQGHVTKSNGMKMNKGK